MTPLEKESYYAILEAIQVLDHYNTGEDFPLSTALRRLNDLKKEFEKIINKDKTRAEGLLDLFFREALQCN